MNGTGMLSRGLAGAAVMAAAFSATYVWSQTAPAPASAPAVPIATGPATTPANTLGVPIAIINGMPVDNQAFYNVLMQVAGPRVFQVVLDLTLVRDGAGKAGVSIPAADMPKLVQEEWNRMREGAAAAAQQPNASAEEKNQILLVAIQRQGLTMAEVNLLLTRQAILRKWSIVGNLEPTADELDRQYIADYDEKVTVHMIPVGADDTQASQRTAKLVEACGLSTADRFKAIDVRILDKALNDLQIGWQSWTIPLGAKEQDIKPIKDTAFATGLNTLSAIIHVKQSDGKDAAVLVYIDSKEKSHISDFPKTNPSVERSLHDKVFAAKQAAWMNSQMLNLRAHMQVVVNDPVLQAYNEQMRAAATREAAAQAAVEPPATFPSLPSTLPAIPAASRPALPTPQPMDTRPALPAPPAIDTRPALPRPGRLETRPAATRPVTPEP